MEAALAYRAQDLVNFNKEIVPEVNAAARILWNAGSLSFSLVEALKVELEKVPLLPSFIFTCKKKSVAGICACSRRIWRMVCINMSVTGLFRLHDITLPVEVLFFPQHVGHCTGCLLRAGRGSARKSPKQGNTPGGTYLVGPY